VVEEKSREMDVQFQQKKNKEEEMQSSILYPSTHEVNISPHFYMVETNINK